MEGVEIDRLLPMGDERRAFYTKANQALRDQYIPDPENSDRILNPEINDRIRELRRQFMDEFPSLRSYSFEDMISGTKSVDEFVKATDEIHLRQDDEGIKMALTPEGVRITATFEAGYAYEYVFIPWAVFDTVRWHQETPEEP